MEKKILGLTLVVLLTVGETVCFAQSAQARVKALQGTWILETIQAGGLIMDVTKPSIAEKQEISYTFEGNRQSQANRDVQKGTTEAYHGGFTINGDTLELFYDEREERFTYTYTIQGNKLILKDQDAVWTYRKRQR